jgi:hypothetical protein
VFLTESVSRETLVARKKHADNRASIGDSRLTILGENAVPRETAAPFHIKGAPKKL